MNKLLENLNILIRPWYWSRLAPINWVWDAKLNELLDECEFSNVEQHTAKIGGYTLWIANHPYNSFYPYGFHGGYDPLPSRKTVYRAYQKLKRHGLWTAISIEEFIQKHENP